MLGLFAGCTGSGSSSAAPAPSASSAAPSTASSAAPETPAAKKTVKIAVFAPMTGDHAEYGLSYKLAAEIQAKKWNDAGGAGDYMIEVVSYDDKSNGDEAAAIAERMVMDKDIVGTIGSYTSGVVMAATPILQEYGLTLIAPSASHPDYTKEGNYIFRNNTMIAIEAEGTLDAVINYQKIKKVGILYIKTDWGVSTSAIVEDLIAKRDGALEIVAKEECMDGSDDYSVPIANFEAAGCEGIIVVGMHNTFVPFARQYRAVNPDINLAAFANLYNQQVIDLGGEAVEGTVFPLSYFNESDDPLVIEFRDAFHAAEGKYPSSLACQAFDAAGMYCEAISKVGADRAAIRDYIQDINYTGAGGNITFDDQGEAIKSFFGVVIKDGKFQLI